MVTTVRRIGLAAIVVAAAAAAAACSTQPATPAPPA